MTPVKNSDPTIREYIVSIFTENQVGVLARITGIFTRRKINIESLKVNETSVKGISMFSIVSFTTEDTIKRIVSAIERIVEVLRAEYHRPDELISQQIALYKVSPDLFKGGGGDACLREHQARVIEIAPEFVVLERTGFTEEIDALKNVLQEKGVLLQFSRSENIVLHSEEVLNGF